MAWYDFAGQLFDPGKFTPFSATDTTQGIDTKLQHSDLAGSQLALAAQGAQQRAAPQIGGTQLATGQMDQSRAGAYGVANRLGSIATGQQAGAGELAVNRQLGQAQASQIAMARMARGPNSVIAGRNAARNSADLGLAGAGQAAQAQMQDQASANAQLGGLYSNLYGQDAGVAAQNAQLGQNAQMANQQASLQQTGLNDTRQMAALGQMLGWDQATIDNQVRLAAIRAGDYASDNQSRGSALQAGGAALAAFSDERLKTDIEDGGDAADEFMSKLRETTWRFRDEAKHGPGHQLGIIAQDLQRSKLGRETVVQMDAEGHIGFDLAKATGAALASVARLNRRLGALEAKAA